MDINTGWRENVEKCLEMEAPIHFTPSRAYSNYCSLREGW